MDSSGIHLVATWGFWILGTGILLTAAFMWGYDVNQKLNFLLGRVKRTGKGQEDTDWMTTHPAVSASGKVISPVAAVAIIGGAIIVLFVIPLLIINR